MSEQQQHQKTHDVEKVSEQPLPPATQAPVVTLPPEASDPRYAEEFRSAHEMEKKAKAEGIKVLGSAAPMSLLERLDALEAVVLKLKAVHDEAEEKAKKDKEGKDKKDEKK